MTDTVNGTRILLITTDGVHTDTVNLSRRALRLRSDEQLTTSIEWYPLTVTTVLDTPEPEFLVEKMAEGDSVFYDTRFMRICRWVKTDFNTSKDRWVEYDESVSSLFNFIPGRLIWAKTLKDRPVHFGRGVTVSLKNYYEIELEAREWTDIGLPFRFSIRMADILEATRGSDSLQVYTWTKDSLSRKYGTSALYIPGLPDKEDVNVTLNYAGGNGFSIYNPGSGPVNLKIPPLPQAMSPYRLQKAGNVKSWSIKVLSRTGDGTALPDVYCGFAPGKNYNYYPASPSFSSTRVYIYNRAQNRRYGHFIGSTFNGLITQEILLVNDKTEPVQINFNLQKTGNFPSGIDALILAEGRAVAKQRNCFSGCKKFSVQMDNYWR